MTDFENILWCYKIDCPNCIEAGHDKDGVFGVCDRKETIINKDGRCKDERNG